MPFSLYPEYALPVLLALVVLFAFPVTKHLQGREEKGRYWSLQALTFLGAMVGAKVGVAFGDFGWPLEPVPGGLPALLASGRTITGGLLGDFLAAELAKPLLGWRRPPNDRFATVLPFSIAIGRVACLRAGCCGGLPHDGPLAFTDAAGVGRWPTQLFELGFQLLVGALFIALSRRGLLQGRLFAVYLMAYGGFRVVTELVRDTPRLLGQVTGYQVIASLLVIAGAASFWLRRPPAPEEVTHGAS